MILKSELKSIIEDQKKTQLKRQQNEVARLEHLQLPEEEAFATILTGIRRCGKSTIMTQLVRRHKEKEVLYLNFDDIRLCSFDFDDFKRLYELIKECGWVYLYFDEIQLVARWEIFIHQLLRESFHIFITGSNASLLSTELGTHLTGRHLSTELFPFSYQEFLQFRSKNDSDDSFSQYLLSGGMPEYLRSGNKLILQTVLDDIIVRDIAVRHGIRDVTAIKQLALYILSNATKLFSLATMAKAIGNKSESTISEYISYLIDAYLVDAVKLYSNSLKNTLRNPPKYYALDTGLISAVSLSKTADAGRLFENLVYICLRKKYKKHIYYYKNKGECDFIVTDELNHPIMACQVCYELNSMNFERELNGLKEAMKNLQLPEGMIITRNESDQLDIDEGKVKIVPIRLWEGLDNFLNHNITK